MSTVNTLILSLIFPFLSYGFSIFDMENNKRFSSNSTLNVSDPDIGSNLVKKMKDSGMSFPEGVTLVESKTTHTSLGTLKTFYLFYNAIEVEGNTLVASFKNDGQLLTVNSNLPLLHLHLVNTALVDTEVFQKAKADIDKILMEIGAQIGLPSKSKLLIIRDGENKPKVVWRFFIGSYVIDVDADGKKAGEIHQMFSTIAYENRVKTYIHPVPFPLGLMLDPSQKGTPILNDQTLTSDGLFLTLANSSLVDDQMRVCSNMVHQTRQLLDSRFGMNSFDNNNGAIHLVFYNGLSNNAFSNNNILGFGPDDGLSRALDVVGHEYTHSIITNTTNFGVQGSVGGVKRAPC